MNPDPQLDYYFIIPHVTEPTVLMLSESNKWSLPHWTPPNRSEAVAINSELRDRFGVNVTVLHWEPYNDLNPKTGNLHRVFVMENHSPTWSPPANGRWIGRKELGDLKFAVPEHRPVLEAWLNEAESGCIPKHRLSWQRTGWFDIVSDWIHAQLERIGTPAVEAIEQLTTKYGSYLIRVNTTAGNVYFKSLPEMYAQEPRLTELLATRYPGHIVKVLAVEDERHWLLSQGFSGTPLLNSEDVAQWEEALRIFASIQIGLSDLIDDLIGTGCPDRRLHILATQIEPFFADLSFLRNANFSDDKIEELKSLIPRLQSACRKLTEYEMPATLEHGDFHCSQVFVDEESIIYIDWANSVVSHPFFSLTRFLTHFSTYWGKHALWSMPDFSRRMRNAYLEPWTIYAPMEQLIEAFDLSQPLAMFEHALNHHNLSFMQTGIRWERTGAVPFFLDLLLNYKR